MTDIKSMTLGEISEALRAMGSRPFAASRYSPGCTAV